MITQMATVLSTRHLLVLIISAIVSSSVAQELPFLIFNGKVQNDLSEPIAGAQVQFWQTDTDGNYNHPNAGLVTLDPNFQYYGTATTDENGDFQFLTRRPGIYPSRPVTHIHFKIFIDGVDVLTSQFYFRDEGTSFNEMLILDLADATDLVPNSSIPTFSTTKNIVIDRGLGGSGPFTPRQAAGPFYPTQDFFNLGSNMVSVTADNQPGTPESSVEPSSSPSTTASSISPEDTGSNSPSANTSIADESSSPSIGVDSTSPPSISMGQTTAPSTTPKSNEKDSSANQPATILLAFVGLVSLALF